MKNGFISDLQLEYDTAHFHQKQPTHAKHQDTLMQFGQNKIGPINILDQYTRHNSSFLSSLPYIWTCVKTIVYNAATFVSHMHVLYIKFVTHLYLTKDTSDVQQERLMGQLKTTRPPKIL